MSYIDEQDKFNASLGKPKDPKIHDWLEDELEPIEEGALPMLILCAVCSHKWVKYIVNPVVAVSLECPECGSTAGILED